jgi:AraC-like DNA-binding protein
MRLTSSTLVQPVTARGVPALDFEFGGTVEIRDLKTGQIRTADPAALIGLLTQSRNQLLFHGNVESFVIVFEPAALYQLFRLPASDHVDCDYPVQAVLDRSASILQQKLGNTRTFQERVAIADECISSWGIRAPARDAIEHVAAEIFRNHGACRIEALANDTGLSMRSFQRLFQQRVGVPAKLFSRIVRFEAALKTKAVFPRLSWTHIAHKFGYADQMHMIHDFRQLSGKTPTGILEQASPLFEPQIDLTAKDTAERLLL